MSTTSTLKLDSYIERAQAAWTCAELILKSGKSECWPFVSHLMAFSLELFMKIYLMSRGNSLREVEKYRHDLLKLIDACSKNDPKFNQYKDSEDLKLFNFNAFRGGLKYPSHTSGGFRIRHSDPFANLKPLVNDLLAEADENQVISEINRVE